MSDQLRQIAIEVLIGAADAALIYFCYRLYKDKCSAAEHIQVKYDKVYIYASATSADILLLQQ